MRRWAVGNVRRQNGVVRRDEPLIRQDGIVASSIPLSFLNLLELRFLASYRTRMPLQAIRRALDYAAASLEVERPLLTVDFKVNGQSLFLKFAEEGGDPYFVNASERGQVAWPPAIEEFIQAVDYDEEERHAYRWWPMGRSRPVIVDTFLNGGIPSTALSGVRTQAIAVRRGEGLDVSEIAEDVGATPDEIKAALVFERAA